MRRLALGVTAISFGVFGLVETMACNGDFDICVGDQCGALEGGPTDATDEQHVPDGCDLTKDPKDSAKCVDDTIGLFVSASGNDSNPGTKSAPLKTIGAAVGKTDSQHSRVYVCAGAYGENVKVATGNKTAGIYGGFSCSDWSYAGGAPNAVVTSTGGGYALEVNNLNTTLTVEDVEFDSTDATTPGASSIAVFITQSTGVILKRVNAKAGKGADGAEAVATSNWDAGAQPGTTAVTNAGGAQCTNVCANGTSIGGKGGTGVDTGATPGGGQDGGPDIPPNPVGANGNGGTGKMVGCNPGTLGAKGADADAGTAGAPPGTLVATGWMTDTGKPGATGVVGQGGGGGSGGTNTVDGDNKAGGGGGGCGGCGGYAGNGGGSGGSSYAVLVFQSTATIDGSTLTSASGGSGELGGDGSVGQAGGAFGDHAASGGNGCQGGAGGAGGAGAGGGGGAAGNSIALGYLGTQPTVTNSTLSKGAAGTPGGGGTGAAGNNGLPGADGISAEQQDLKP